MRVGVVVPHDIDDPAVVSGGNAYDRRVCDGLAAAGWTVQEIPVAGDWPRPDADARSALAAALDACDDGAVVLLDGLVACGVPEVVVPRAGRLALVVLVHLPLGEEAPELAEGERAVLHAVSAVVATSGWTARRLAEVHGLDAARVHAARVHVASPGVDPAPLASGGDGTRLLCVGSITPTKGQDVLVDALSTVEENWTCDLVGPLHRHPAHVARIQHAITAYGLNRQIRVTGPLTGAMLDTAFDAADLLVLPSRAEAYGMVVTEALARGTPVLASAVGGVSDVVGAGGLLVAPGDPDALAAALRRWLTEPELRARLRRRAVERRRSLDGWEGTTRCLTTALHRAERLSTTPA